MRRRREAREYGLMLVDGVLEEVDVDLEAVLGVALSSDVWASRADSSSIVGRLPIRVSMREVKQLCRRCEGTFYVAVDAWSGRPGLSGLTLCPRCDRGEVSIDTFSDSDRPAWPAVVFFLAVVGAIAVGFARAWS